MVVYAPPQLPPIHRNLAQHMPSWFRALDDEPREPCTLVKNFIARQGIILIAGIIFFDVDFHQSEIAVREKKFEDVRCRLLKAGGSTDDGRCDDGWSRRHAGKGVWI